MRFKRVWNIRNASLAIKTHSRRAKLRRSKKIFFKMLHNPPAGTQRIPTPSTILYKSCGHNDVKYEFKNWITHHRMCLVLSTKWPLILALYRLRAHIHIIKLGCVYIIDFAPLQRFSHAGELYTMPRVLQNRRANTFYHTPVFVLYNIIIFFYYQRLLNILTIAVRTIKSLLRTRKSLPPAARNVVLQWYTYSV